LGPLCGISWTNIGKIERGLSSPSVQTLVHIATGLGIDPGSLISGISAADYDKAPKRRFTVQEFLAARAEAETDQ
jgi:transcriptional regulator with XRE-family HTH domain